MASQASEASIVRSIRQRVEAIPHTCIKKLWSTGYSRDIDLVVVTHGLACWYEIKKPGEVPEPWQVGRMKYWARSLADVGWFDNVTACVARVKQMAERGAAVQDFLRMQDAANPGRMQPFILIDTQPTPVETAFPDSHARIQALLQDAQRKG